MGSAVSRSELRLVHPQPRARRQPVPSEVLGMTIFVLAEAMMFAGFVSAFSITKASAPMWPPAGQPRLPLEETAINTLALLVSGALVWWSGRKFDRVGPRSARWPLVAGVVLGLFFVAFQGFEWQALVREGLTLRSSPHGSFFYLIVGAHALHVVFGMSLLGAALVRLSAERLTSDAYWAARLFWYFVVLMWPVLYVLVYR